VFCREIHESRHGVGIVPQRALARPYPRDKVRGPVIERPLGRGYSFQFATLRSSEGNFTSTVSIAQVTAHGSLSCVIALPFAIAAVNWSQLPATREITLVPKVRTQALLLRDCIVMHSCPTDVLLVDCGICGRRRDLNR